MLKDEPGIQCALVAIFVIVVLLKVMFGNYSVCVSYLT